jgi:type IV secretory pathway VirB10-like protein
MTGRELGRHPSPQELVAAYEEGWSIKELARLTGWNQSVVASILQQQGVQPPALPPGAKSGQPRQSVPPQPRLVPPAAAVPEPLAARRAEVSNQREAQRRRRERERIEGFLAEYSISEEERRRARAARLDRESMWRAEIEFERRERAQLITWLKNYGDILTGD